MEEEDEKKRGDKNILRKSCIFVVFEMPKINENMYVPLSGTEKKPEYCEGRWRLCRAVQVLMGIVFFCLFVVTVAMSLC